MIAKKLSHTCGNIALNAHTNSKFRSLGCFFQA
jgi:hypothetical protein